MEMLDYLRAKRDLTFEEKTICAYFKDDCYDDELTLRLGKL